MRGWWKRLRQRRFDKLMAEARRRASFGPPVLYFKSAILGAALGGYLIGLALEGIGHKPWWICASLAISGAAQMLYVYRVGRVILPSADEIGRMVGAVMDEAAAQKPELKQ